MTQITDPYEELGVDRSASTDEINLAYRKQARRHHPDKGGEREKFERIGTAVAILRDPEKRAKFDRDGTVDDRPEQDERAQAFGLINGHLGAIVNEYVQSGFAPEKNPEALDVIKVVRTMLHIELEQAQGMVAIGKKHAALLKRMKRRLTRRKNATGADLITAAIDQQMANSQRQVEAITEGLELHKRAIELLDDYSFEVDRPPTSWSTTGFSAGGWPIFDGSGS